MGRKHSKKLRHVKNQFAAIAFACFLLTGCGQSGPKTIPVTGHVTYNNAPVPEGMILFIANSVDGRSGKAFLEPDGSYSATSFHEGDGLMPGTYRISFMPHGAKIPSRYTEASKSGLTVTVDESSGAVTYDMPLADEK